MHIFPCELFEIMAHSPCNPRDFFRCARRLEIGAAHPDQGPGGQSEGPDYLGGEAYVLQLRGRNGQWAAVAQTVRDRDLLGLDEEGPPPLEQVDLEQLGHYDEDHEVGDHPDTHARGRLVEEVVEEEGEGNTTNTCTEENPDRRVNIRD